MNKQGNKENPGGGIEWCHIFGPGTGYTTNPLRGCEHDCKWQMGDKVVTCYAKAQRERMDGPGSFEKITFHPHVLEEIRNKPKACGIFIDSMSDLFGKSVPSENIQQVVDTMRECPRHIFFTLTKNPSRLREFEFSNNVLCGMSSPPKWINGKEMSEVQQRTWFKHGLGWLMETKANNRWLSMEPLAVDVVDILQYHLRGTADKKICFVVIGAGSDGHELYQPDEELFRRTVAVFDAERIPVFFKGNVDGALAERVAGGWRNKFPSLERFQRDAYDAAI